MATIGSLIVSVKARTKAFSKGLTGARKRLAKFSKSIPGANINIAKLGAGMAAAAAGGMALLVKRSLSAIDATTKMADRLGLSTEALSKLQFAAKLSGVKVETLSLGLQRMTRRIAEAGQGTGEAKAAIKELGLDVKTLAGLNPDEQFRLIADAMEGVKFQGDRVRLAMRLFDSEGVALINTMVGGAAALDKMGDEADRLGLTFDRVDAAKIEAANNAFIRLGSAITGAANTLAIQLAPFLEAAANEFVAMGTSGEGMGEKVVNAFEFVLKAIAKAADFIKLLQSGWKFLQATAQLAITGMVKGLGFLLTKFESVLKFFGKKLPAGLDSFNRSLKAFGKESQKTTERLSAEASDLFDQFSRGDAQKDVTALFKRIQDGAEKAAKKTVEVLEPMKDLLGEGIVGGVKKAIKTAQFQAINLRRIAIGGPGRVAKEQRVMDPQLQETNKLLKKISLSTGIAGVAIAG